LFDQITESDFRKKLKFGIDDKTHHVFFFYGEEDYLKHAAIEAAKTGIVSDPSFDFVYIGAAEYSAETLTTAIAAPPMFSQFRLVAVSVSFKDLRPGDVNDLIDILSEVDDGGYTVVLLSLPSDGFDPGILPKRPSPVYKKLAEVAVPVVFERVTGAKLNGWVSKHYAGNKLLADAQVCAFTVSYCSEDMFRLASEIDKVSYFVLSEGRDRVTVEDVKKIACSVSEFDAFALANAIVSGNKKLALEVLGYVKTQKKEPVEVMSEINRALCDMVAVDACKKSGMSSEQISSATGIKPYPLSRYLSGLERTDTQRLKAALDAARSADLAVKGYSKDYISIEQFICSL